MFRRGRADLIIAIILALLLADAVRVVCCLPAGPLPCHWRRFTWTTPAAQHSVEVCLAD